MPTPEFERVSGQATSEIEGRHWNTLRGHAVAGVPGRKLGAAVVDSSDRVGTFRIDRKEDEAATVEVYSNIIQDEDGTPTFRLVALVDVGSHDEAVRNEHLEQNSREGYPTP